MKDRHRFRDVTEADDGDQHNNRLLSYDVRDGPITIERTWYRYSSAGNVARLVKETNGAQVKDVFWFYYNASGQLWLTVRGQGDYDEVTQDVTNAVYFDSAEYRYDSGRQRYLVRARDPNNGFAILGSGQWRDYLGESVYNDYMVEVDETSGDVIVTPGMSYAPGIGFDDPALADMPAYVGSDLIGTTRRVTDSSAVGAAVIERTVYTAFGERVSLTDGSGNPTPSPVSRYGYAGAWGYEEAACEPPGAPTGWCDPLTTLGWLHVGERYYNPSVGRFMQRDPIGIRGGLNVYEYARSEPISTFDPDGLLPDHGFDFMAFARANREIGIPWEQSVRQWTEANGWALVAGCGGAIAWQSIPIIASTWKYLKRIRVRPMIHAADHPFPIIGKARHIQITIYLKGIKGSHINIRIPF